MTDRIDYRGRYVLDGDAARWIDSGGDGPYVAGIQGLVWNVVPDVLDEQTGAIDDVLLVATRHHGRIGWHDIRVEDVKRSHPCSRQDARAYVSLCQRELAYAKRGKVDRRVIEVMAFADGIAAAPEPVALDPADSILHRADAARATDADLAAAYERMQAGINERRRLAGRPPIGDTAA